MPRFTSARTSPWVATTRSLCVATITPQPTPQKRHGALLHFSRVRSWLVMRLLAAAGICMPTAEAATAAALAFANWRRVSFIRSEEHTSELQSRGHLVCRLLLDKKDKE